jgi:hypothetical protein
MLFGILVSGMDFSPACMTVNDQQGHEPTLQSPRHF